MPSQILHTLFGEDVLSRIIGKLAPRNRIIPADPTIDNENIFGTSFILGCQGPDIFYHNRRTRPVGLEYGSLLHRRGYGTFCAHLLKTGLSGITIDTSREIKISSLGLYSAGFLTHAFLDRAAHPYIVFKSTPVPPVSSINGGSAFFHLFLERILDTLMLKKLRGEEVSSWKQEEYLVKACENPVSGLFELIERSLVLAFPERAGKDEKLALRIKNTFYDSARFYRMTDPEQTTMKNPRYMYTLAEDFIPYLFPEKFSSSDPNFLNLEHNVWTYPRDGYAEDRRSFTEIYDSALEEAVNSIFPLFDVFLKTGVISFEAAAEAIGNGGLSITDKSGKPSSPTVTDPFPLGKVLIEQAVMRGLYG